MPRQRRHTRHQVERDRASTKDAKRQLQTKPEGGKRKARKTSGD